MRMMEPTMQIEVPATGIRMSAADYSALKDKLVREARIAQAAAIRAAFGRLIATVVAFATGGRTAMVRSGN